MILGGARREGARAVVSRAAPLARFGVIADVQYADVDDMYNYARTTKRGYRGALDALGRAVSDWDAHNVDFVVDLGDMVDQVNDEAGVAHTMLQRVLNEFAKLRCKHYHLVGNHELYNFTRAEIEATIPGVVGAGSGLPYHSFAPVEGWRFIVLDTYDMHCITDKETPRDIEAVYQLLEQNNPNNVRAKRGTENWVAGLKGEDARWAPYNGGVRPAQLTWLGEELAAAKAGREKVVVFCHVPLAAGAAGDSTLVWNHKDVLTLLHRSEIVTAVFAGHYHRGGYTQDAGGVHHVTLPSPLNINEEHRTAHAVVELHHDALVVNGRGLVPSYDFPVLGLARASL